MMIMIKKSKSNRFIPSDSCFFSYLLRQWLWTKTNGREKKAENHWKDVEVYDSMTS
jgi:hypothetical protein